MATEPRAMDPETYWRYNEVTMPSDDWLAEHGVVLPGLVTSLVLMGQAKGWFGDVTPGSELAAAQLMLRTVFADRETGAAGAGWMLCLHCGHPWWLTPMRVPYRKPYPESPPSQPAPLPAVRPA